MVKQIKINHSHTARKCQSLDVNQAIWTCSYHAVPVHTWMNNSLELSSPQFSSIVSDSLWLHGLQHARLLCPSLTPGDCSNLCPSSQWCHPTISVIPFYSHFQYFPASRSFQTRQLFTSGGQSIGASALALVLPMEIQTLYLLGLTSLMSLKSKGLSKVFSNTTVHKHQFFSAQLSLWCNSHIHTWLLEKL